MNMIHSTNACPISLGPKFYAASVRGRLNKMGVVHSQSQGWIGNRIENLIRFSHPWWISPRCWDYSLRDSYIFE